ncbi:GxxExxY protein [Betaproteobacteria bacterium SCN2]|nr:GxxExxY protein [Betaproteobacteria bacterium SCN2]
MNEVGEQAIGAAIRVHSSLGPGLLESAYEICLHHELSKLGLDVQRQLPLPIVYDGVKLDAGYRLDLVVNRVVLELKTVDKLQPIHTAQLLSYLRLGNYKLGYLLNFHVLSMRDGIKRVANNL